MSWKKGNVPLKLQKVILDKLVARNIIGLQFKSLVRIFLFLKFLGLMQYSFLFFRFSDLIQLSLLF